MEVCNMALASLHQPEKNVRIHSPQQIRELKRSLTQFGQTRAIVIDENNTILIGNGLYQAMKDLGYTEATVYIKSGLTENEKKKLMIADNKTYSLGIDNMETLNSFLEDLKDDLDIPGYDEAILQEMVADADTVTQKLSEYGTLDDNEIQSIKANTERRERAEGTDEAQAWEPEGEDAGGEPADIQKFVICPKCGEKIWL